MSTSFGRRPPSSPHHLRFLAAGSATAAALLLVACLAAQPSAAAAASRLGAAAGGTAPSDAAQGSPGRGGRSGVPALGHVFLVVMENLDYAQAMATPGLEALAGRYALATRYYAASHPSLPNYLALTSGSTWGVASDCTSCYVAAPNLFSELAAAHVGYGAYFEGLDRPCDLAPSAGAGYAGKHDPFRYYEDVRASPSLCSHILPYGRLAPLLAGPAASVPRFVWVTPNLCDDGHDCPPTTAAAWLARFVGEVTRSAAWRGGGVLFVTWDESNGDDSAVVPPGRVVASGGGGQVMTLVVDKALRPGLRVGVAYDHCSLLATIEDGLGLPLLAGAKTATPMAAFFAGGVARKAQEP